MRMTAAAAVGHKGVPSEFGKNRTLSRWQRPSSRKLSFLRNPRENAALPGLALFATLSKTAIKSSRRDRRVLRTTKRHVQQQEPHATIRRCWSYSFLSYDFFRFLRRPQKQNSAPTKDPGPETAAPGPITHRRTCACPRESGRQKSGSAPRGKTRLSPAESAGRNRCPVPGGSPRKSPNPDPLADPTRQRGRSGPQRLRKRNPPATGAANNKTAKVRDPDAHKTVELKVHWLPGLLLSLASRKPWLPARFLASSCPPECIQRATA